MASNWSRVLTRSSPKASTLSSVEARPKEREERHLSPGGDRADQNREHECFHESINPLLERPITSAVHCILRRPGRNIQKKTHFAINNLTRHARKDSEEALVPDILIPPVHKILYLFCGSNSFVRRAIG